jgi:radical SAM superfamily enzyme with C-terminal helix-hairpin-helix motif
VGTRSGLALEGFPIKKNKKNKNKNKNKKRNIFYKEVRSELEAKIMGSLVERGEVRIPDIFIWGLI